MRDEEIERVLEVLSDREQYKYFYVPRYQGKEFFEYCKAALAYINRLKEEKYRLEQNLGQCENGYSLELLTANMRIRSLEQDKQTAETQLKELLSALYRQADNKDRSFMIYQKDVVEIANDYGVDLTNES